jgi:nucleoside-diphosphate-sugar epimerase
MKKILVTGAGGFIGHHLVSYLKDHGFGPSALGELS